MEEFTKEYFSKEELKELGLDPEDVEYHGLDQMLLSVCYRLSKRVKELEQEVLFLKRHKRNQEKIPSKPKKMR